MPSDVPEAWYEDFFTELPNEFWRRAVPPEATLAEVDFVERRLGLRAPARVLDVPCGSGRHSIELARRGHRVTGVDISADAIAHARGAAAEAGVEVDLVRDEMRALPRTGAFEAAICMGNSVGYLDLAGLRDFLAALAAAVRPGRGLGRLRRGGGERPPGVHRGGPSHAGRRHQRRGVHRVRRRGEPAAQHVPVLPRRGAPDRDGDPPRVHHGHLGALLAEAGFRDVETYAGPDGAPYALGSGRLLLTARRAAP